MAVTAHIEELSEKRSLMTGLATGYEKLDEYTSGLQKTENGFPQGAPAFRHALVQPVDLSQVAAQSHAKHIGADLATDPLSLQLLR